MHPLPMRPTVHLTGGIDPELREGVEQRLQFRAEAAGEPEVPDIRSVPGGRRWKYRRSSFN